MGARTDNFQGLTDSDDHAGEWGGAVTYELLSSL